MSCTGSSLPSADDVLIRLKELSGRSIERARRASDLTQNAVAKDVGISVRWLRELEGGNPTSTLDIHLRCARQLGMPFGQLLFPLLCMSRGMAYPFLLAALDTAELEDRCIAIIAQRNARIFRDYLSQTRHRDAIEETVNAV